MEAYSLTRKISDPLNLLAQFFARETEQDGARQIETDSTKEDWPDSFPSAGN